MRRFTAALAAALLLASLAAGAVSAGRPPNCTYLLTPAPVPICIPQR